jgi:hypothetical protein
MRADTDPLIKINVREHPGGMDVWIALKRRFLYRDAD